MTTLRTPGGEALDLYLGGWCFSTKIAKLVK